MTSTVCVVTGVGPGNGAALTHRFARAGYKVAMLARSGDRLRELEQRIDGARGYVADVADATAVEAAFARIRSELGPVDVLVHNAGSGVFASSVRWTREPGSSAWWRPGSRDFVTS